MPFFNLDWLRDVGKPAPVRDPRFPVTFPDEHAHDEESGPTRVFDPALKQFPRAFRPGDPEFADASAAQRWYAARWEVISRLLGSVAESAYRDHLVLRGSLLLTAWLGPVARTPDDIDWVVTPTDWELTGREARGMLESLVKAVSGQADAGEAAIQADRIAADDIWTYERAPGRRLVFPWQVEGLPPGQVQMDFVFGEALPEEPGLTTVPTAYGGSVVVRAASLELSLAWKLLWLETDIYPQGKDLYDAVLLAERTRLRLPLLDRVFQEAGNPTIVDLKPDFALEWEVDWENFLLEYPGVAGSAADWQERLTAALAPMFAEARNEHGA